GAGAHRLRSHFYPRAGSYVHRDVRVRDLAEVGPDRVVEDAGAERGDDRIDGADRDRRPDLAERERLGEIGDSRDVIQMRVRHDRMLDRELLGNGQGAGYRAAVDQDLVV